MPGITLALSVGRIFDATLPLLQAAGIAPTEDPEASRKLIVPTRRPDVRRTGRDPHAGQAREGVRLRGSDDA